MFRLTGLKSSLIRSHAQTETCMRRMMIALAAAALAAGCQPKAANEAAETPGAAPAATPEAAPAAAASAGPAIEPVVARGTEPFWNVEADAAQVILTRPEHGPLKFAAVFEQAGTVRIWSGRDLVLKIQPGECSDGMSDTRYPMKAEFEFGGEMLSGCAFEKRAPPPGPKP